MDAVDLSNLHILVVDDESGALEALADIFEDQHSRVTTAASAAEARIAFHSQQFDVALLDIRLPDARGTDLLREIRESSDSTRCIMVTASSEAEDAINALNEGASAYIQKPIDIDAMKRTIVEVVAKYRQSAEERRQLRDLDIIRSIGEAAMDLDLERMLNNVLRRAVDGTLADAGAILLYDEAPKTLKGEVQYKLSDEPISNYVVGLGEGIAGKVAAERRVMDVEDIAAANLGLPSYLHHAGVVSAIAAPIVSPKGLLGALVITWRTPRAFTVQDRNLMGVISQRLSLATANAKLYEREDASKQRAEYLARVSQELNSQIEDVQEVASRLTRLATERLGDGCTIFLASPDSSVLEVLECYHTVPEKQQLLERRLRERPVIIGEGNVGQAALTLQPVIASPEAILAAYPNRRYLETLGFASSIAVPIRVHGDLLGVMSCSITESDAIFDAEQEALAVEFAERAAVAIENAILLREAERKREELQALFTLTNDISSTLEESRVIESLLAGAAELVGVPACCVASYRPGQGAPVIEHELGMHGGSALEIATAAFEPWSQDMLGSVEPFFVKSLTDCGNDAMAETAGRLRFVSMLSVAIGVEAARERVLMVFTRASDESLEGKSQLLATLGGLAGVALTNALSYKRELAIAERVQQWILTTEFGEHMETGIEGVEIATDYHAALMEANVGGDFYDFFPVVEGLLGIVIGDVSGKGLDAALQTQAAKHTLRAYALDSGGGPPADVLKRTNDAICRMLPADVFITLFYATLDIRTKVLTWANAGHDSPLLCSPDSTVVQLDSSGRALGLMPEAAYTQSDTALKPGDVLLMYTDGLTEARRNGIFLETAGVAGILLRHNHMPPKEIVEHIYDEVREYTSGNLHDDIAMLAIKIVG
ncbi:MAG TPA: SpoIIE family protein phosphatase [Armatimonadota bacterium]|jgi:GAF domain-containing protein/CheY-like chemotaxis protein